MKKAKKIVLLLYSFTVLTICLFFIPQTIYYKIRNFDGPPRLVKEEDVVKPIWYSHKKELFKKAKTNKQTTDFIKEIIFEKRIRFSYLLVELFAITIIFLTLFFLV